MVLRDSPTWLRGGIICGLISIIISLIWFIISGISSSTHSALGVVFYGLYMLISIPVIFIIPIKSLFMQCASGAVTCIPVPNLTGAIINVILWFIIGSLVGLLIGIKSKKE